MKKTTKLFVENYEDVDKNWTTTVFDRVGFRIYFVHTSSDFQAFSWRVPVRYPRYYIPESSKSITSRSYPTDIRKEKAFFLNLK